MCGVSVTLLLFALLVLTVNGRVYFSENFHQVSTNGKSSWKTLVIQSNSERGKNYEAYSTKTFMPVENVEDLYIVNKIDILQPNVFQQLHQLNNLNLAENSLPVLIAGDFGGLKLSKLSLIDNDISRIESKTFSNSSIGHIDLSHNRLHDIPAQLFDGAGLTKLILANNTLTTIAERSFSSNLTHLDLSRNRIRDIPVTVFENLFALKHLNLSRNNLPTVTSAYWLHSLEVLDVSHNVIRLLINGAFEDYPKLRELYMQSNELLYLNPKSFTKPSPIQLFHVERNMLTFLPGELGAIFANLKYLKYGGNPWSCSCLVPVEGFIKTGNIQMDTCEKHFFTDGKQAICLTAYSDCYGNETLLLLGHPEIYQGLIDDYNC